MSIAALLVACGNHGRSTTTSSIAEETKVDNAVGRSIQALVRPSDLDPDKVALGKRLFSDPLLSGDRTISCASCHDLSTGGADARRYSLGIGGQVGRINAPTVFNADLNVKQFWDGRAASLADQVDGPVSDPTEMGGRWREIIGLVGADPWYRTAFSREYPEGVTRSSISDAIATYERALVTVGSPFDRWVAGDENALSAEAKEGHALFETIGCASCHQGKNVGGNMFEKIGIMEDYFAERGGPITEADLGRFNVTKDPRDKHAFRVPSLRLASKTAPYFHDGSIEKLDDAILAMGRYQLGKTLSPHEVSRLSAFVVSLAGEVPRP